MYSAGVANLQSKKNKDISFYSASAVVTVDSSHMTASSSASWSSFSPPSKFVSEHVSTMWFMSVTGHNHRKVIGQDPICVRHGPWPVLKWLSRDHV